MSGNRISTAYKRPTWYHVVLFLLGPIGLLVCYLIFNVTLMLLLGFEEDNAEGFAALAMVDWAVLMVFRWWTVVRTGFRTIDMLRFFIPFYSLYFSCIVWWRYTSLPYNYWEGDVVSHNELRKKVYKDAVRRGAPNRLADLTSYAMVPLDDRQRPTKRYAEELQQMIVHTNAAIRAIPSNDRLQGVVIDAIQSYALLARDCGEAWYFNKFTSLLTKYGINPIATSAPVVAPAPQSQWAAPQVASPVMLPPAPATPPDPNRPSWMPPKQ